MNAVCIAEGLWIPTGVQCQARILKLQQYTEGHILVAGGSRKGAA